MCREAAISTYLVCVQQDIIVPEELSLKHLLVTEIFAPPADGVRLVKSVWSAQDTQYHVPPGFIALTVAEWSPGHAMQDTTVWRVPPPLLQ
jgi:hypothetical protein